MWGVAQRTTGVAVADLQRAVDDGAMLRTHVLRPTWHFVAPDDIGWLQALTGPRVHALNAYHYRQFGIDDETRGADQRADHRGAGAAATTSPARSWRRCSRRRIPGGRHQAGVRGDVRRARRADRQRADARQAAHLRAGRGAGAGRAAAVAATRRWPS